MNVASRLAYSLRFPFRNEAELVDMVESYIELPKEIGERPFKTAGVFITASNLIKLLLPGSENRQV